MVIDTLSSSIIHDLSDAILITGKRHGSTALAYHYFDFSDPRKQACEGLITSLIHQLFLYSPRVPEDLERLYKETHRQSTFTIPALTATFCSMLTKFEQVYIVIDALDECKSDLYYASDLHRVTEFLENILQSSASNARVLLTSRPGVKVHQRLCKLIPKDCIIHLTDQTGATDDIKIYIDTVLKDTEFLSIDRNRVPPGFLEEIEQRLLEGADGMCVESYYFPS